MAAPEAASDNAPAADPDAADVVLQLDIDAATATVWDLLASADGLSAMLQGQVSLDARKGGKFRAEFPNFGMVIGGEVDAMDPERGRFALTWGSEAGPLAADFPAGSSLLDFRLSDGKDGGCGVRLRHGGLPSAQSAQDHEAGWRFHLSRLALEANRADLARGLARTLPLWFQAWNDPDEESRRAALDSSCASDVRFQDEWATLQGVASLSVHIANCHRFMPGWRIEQAGEPRICRGEALAGWRSKGPGGAQDGHNHVRASHDGVMRRVAGFSAPPPAPAAAGAG